MRELRGKLALVTGAASGIGRATALHLASAGAELILCDLDEVRLRAVAEEVGARSRVRLARRVDVAARDEMRALAEEVHQLAPALDILVNNAGIGQVGGVLDTPLEAWDAIIGVNLLGVVHGCHFFAPKMAARGEGHIVNVSSGLGLIGAPRVLAYCTTKFAVLGMSESMRAELAPRGVGVSAICPGIIATDITARGTTFHGARDPETMHARVSAIFAKRGHAPGVVAEAIVRAIQHNQGLVPVPGEVKGIYLLKRLFPGLVERFSGAATARLLGQ